MMDSVRFPQRDEQLEAGLARIREEFAVPGEFPPDVVAAAAEAARRPPGTEHADRTGEPFVTLDPATATDLDQAFAITTDRDDVVLRYAIADVGFFVRPGDPIDVEAWRRGVTVYLAGDRAPLYPPALCDDAASLLPDGPRPAVVFTVRVDPDGDARLDGVERALIESRAKLDYESVRTEDLPAPFAELSRRIVRAEQRREAPRVEFPDQELERTDDGFELRFRPRLESEDQNAAMSLATNLAVAGALHAAGTGLFRVMPEPDDRALHRLRSSAKAFGLEWPANQSVGDFERALPRRDPRAAAFLLAVRRASGGASYESHRDGVRPWHAAVAATYAHATAPLRRLGDRYVIEAALAVANGRPVADELQAAFEKLPEVMERTETRADRVESAVIALAEAVWLAGRVGESFDAVVVDEDRHGVVIQLADPAVLARIEAHHLDPGDEVRVRLDAVDVPSRRFEFERVG
jgi:exoribonuclease R